MRAVRGPLIEIWDPTDEGERLLAALREEFAVRTIEHAAIPLTRADVLVMAGDADGALAALKILRDDASDGGLPVILLGVPPGARVRHDGPAFGADAVLARPVSADLLIEKCHALLGDEEEVSEVSWVGVAPVEPTMTLSSEDPDSSQVLLVHKSDVHKSDRERSEPSPEAGWIRREPTLQLGDPGDDIAPEISAVQTGGTSRENTGVRPGSRTGSSTGAIATPASIIPLERRATLSPALVSLFLRADRRAFPDSPPLDYHLPASEERPGALVPPELLERAAAIRIDEPLVEDPIDAFTYVGGPAVPPANYSTPPEPDTDEARASSTAEPTPARADMTTAPEAESRALIPRTRSGWPENDTVLGRPTDDGMRRGVLGPGGALRLLFRVTSLELDASLHLETDDGLSLEMTFVEGALKTLTGPIARAALASLERRSRARETAADETAAGEALERLVSEGRIGRFELDRVMREAREAMLTRLIGAERAAFTLTKTSGAAPRTSGHPVLGRPLAGALIEAARDALDHARVQQLLGPTAGLARATGRETALDAAELTPEIVSLIERMNGAPLREFIAAAPTERGLAGVLFALVASDALVLTDARAAPPASTLDRAVVTHLIRTAADLTLDADYFTIVGVERNASLSAIDRAYRQRRSEIESVALSALGLDELDRDRERILEALDEAYAVLQDPRLSSAYRAALP